MLRGFSTLNLVSPWGLLLYFLLFCAVVYNIAEAVGCSFQRSFSFFLTSQVKIANLLELLSLIRLVLGDDSLKNHYASATLYIATVTETRTIRRSCAECAHSIEGHGHEPGLYAKK
jgi:hypothetical protein